MLRDLLERRAAIAADLRALNETPAGNDGDLSPEQRSRWDTLKGELETLEQRISRQATLDDAERRMQGQPVGGTGDVSLDREIARVGMLDVVRAAMGGTDHAAGRAREISAELERRSGRKAQGMFWHMGQPIERRVLTTAAPAGGPGSNLIATEHRPDLFIDRLRNTTRVRSLGATVLTGLTGNLSIPRRKASITAGWVAENTALPNSDPQFEAITLSPKHAGAISEWSRNMILQASPDVEQLARNDMAATLSELLDAAAISGTGANNQPTGILNTAGIGTVAMGTNGSAPTFDKLADLVGLVEDANADGTSMGFLTNTKVRRAAAKVKDSAGIPLGLDVMFQGQRVAVSNIVPSNLTKGTGTNLSAAIYGNWSDLLIGVWSELDLLVNPFESTAYSKGNVSIRAMMTVDIAVRHPESFAAITDLVA
ncbi:MAG TPA: phage major capsid protein [Roseomonas sp.]|nr:phage major capsid protein [Roseomonas sp.]